MGPAFFVMAILGCGEADTACQQVGVADSHYATIEDCNRAAAAVIGRFTDAPYPVIVAQCGLADGVRAERVMPSEVKLPEARQEPKVRRANYRPGRPLRG